MDTKKKIDECIKKSIQESLINSIIQVQYVGVII